MCSALWRGTRVSAGVGVGVQTRLGEVQARYCMPLRRFPGDAVCSFEIGLQ